MTDKPLIDSKTKLDWFRSIVVAAFVVGTLWATLNSRLKAVEEALADKPSRMEFDHFKQKVKELETEIDNHPTSMELKPMQNTLKRIEGQFNEMLPRVHNIEKELAVLNATRDSKKVGSNFRKSYIGDVE